MLTVITNVASQIHHPSRCTAWHVAFVSITMGLCTYIERKRDEWIKRFAEFSYSFWPIRFTVYCALVTIILLLFTIRHSAFSFIVCLQLLLLSVGLLSLEILKQWFHLHNMSCMNKLNFILFCCTSVYHQQFSFTLYITWISTLNVTENKFASRVLFSILNLAICINKLTHFIDYYLCCYYGHHHFAFHILFIFIQYV